MIYSFNYKRGTQVFDNVKSLADAINFELPRNWDCRNEMEAKTNEIDAFMQKKVSCAHLGVVGLFDSYTPHMATTMLNATWYCAVSAYDKAIRNLHCVVRMHTGYDYPYAVGVGTSLAADRNPGKMKSFLGALWDLGAFIPENSFEYMPRPCRGCSACKAQGPEQQGRPQCRQCAVHVHRHVRPGLMPAGPALRRQCRAVWVP